ncbi:MAG TPA: hypothetical protein P5531_08790 [Bacteroidales bacterium]|nr:hypothetical protein [Bacteroidales bacterium]HSA43815.1 hypothetical protein [Bacteroidales bacterium]
MKSTLYLLRWAAGICLVLLLQACPVSLDFPLGEEGIYPLDKALLGTWVNQGSGEDIEVKEVEVRALDAYTYRITVLQKTGSYMMSDMEFNAWIAKLDGEAFLVIDEGDGQKFLHYCYRLKGKQVTLYDMGLLDGGMDAVLSVESLRDQVSRSMKMPEFFENGQIFRKN